MKVLNLFVGGAEACSAWRLSQSSSIFLKKLRVCGCFAFAERDSKYSRDMKARSKWRSVGFGTTSRIASAMFREMKSDCGPQAFAQVVATSSKVSLARL